MAFRRRSQRRDRGGFAPPSLFPVLFSCRVYYTPGFAKVKPPFVPRRPQSLWHGRAGGPRIAPAMTRALAAILGILLACAFGVAAVPGCGSASAPEAGGELRLLSLTPSVTEIFFAMGLGHRVVGRSSYCTYPPAALDVPVVGDTLSLDLEKVLALKPTHAFLITRRMRRVQRLEALGIETVALDSDTLPQLRAAVARVGEVTGHPSAARDLLARIEADLDAVRRDVAGLPRPRTLFTFPMTVGSVEMLVAGRGSFVDDLLDAAGAENAYPARADWPRIGPQKVIELAPEVVLIHAAGVDPGSDRARAVLDAWTQWRSVPAVAGGRLHLVTEPYLTIPGPRVGQAARRLARAVHPELRE